MQNNKSVKILTRLVIEVLHENNERKNTLNAQVCAFRLLKRLQPEVFLVFE